MIEEDFPMDKIEIVNTYDFKKGVLSKEAERHWYRIFCKQLNPLDLLKSKLNEYQRDLEKSSELYKQNKITVDLHLKHRVNLTGLIRDYTFAIKILETHIEE